MSPTTHYPLRAVCPFLRLKPAGSSTATHYTSCGVPPLACFRHPTRLPCGLKTFLAIFVFGVTCSLRQDPPPCEAPAIRRIQQIHSAEAQFMSEHQHFGAAVELTLPDEMPRCGYRYTIQPRPNGYTIEARPDDYPTYPRRSFYSDQTFIIRQVRDNAPATSSDPELR
jgi:hypothetical protein